MIMITQFLRTLGQRLGYEELSTKHFPEDVADRLRRGQLRGTVRQMRVMVLSNTLFAPILSMQAWNRGANAWVILWTTAVVLFSWWLFVSWRKTYLTNGSKADMQRFVTETFVNSLFWTIGMFLFYPIVDSDGKAIITTVIAGSLALGTIGFSRAPSAGFVYLGVQVVGNSLVAFSAWLQTGKSTDLLLTFLIIASGVSLFTMIIERSKASMAAFKNFEQLSEKSEVVELLLRDYEDQTTEWLWQTDQNDKIIRAPVQILELVGLTENDFQSAKPFSVLASRCTQESQADIDRLRTAIQAKIEFHDIRLSLRDPKSGGLRWILLKGRPQFDQGEFRGFRGIFADATESISAERQVQFLATHDPLTNLLNRNSVHGRLSRLRAGEQFAAAFAIDLDGFKQVNDSYGHAVGDRLVEKVATQLQAIDAMGRPESWTARIGGDEFFILLTSDQPIKCDTINDTARQIRGVFSGLFEIDDFKLQIKASIGVAQWPQDTQHGLELLKLSDMAMYDAKAAGGDRIVKFDPMMQTLLNRRSAIIERLKIAVEHGDIQPFYQPQHALCDGRLIGFEALARWTDSELGFIGPDVFIPIAEQTGLIVELGEQLLRAACLDGARWARLLGDAAPVVSVNISPVQFARDDMAEMVARVLSQTGLEARLLEIEVTEGVLIGSKDRVSQTLNEISALGVSIALDDFGTGYSSLSYLNELPLDRLKIDRSFVNAVAEGQENPIVSAIIQLGHKLGLSVIAEGIETDAQRRTLTGLGCDDGQGYLFSKAVPVDAANRLSCGSITILGTDARPRPEAQHPADMEAPDAPPRRKA